MEAKVEIISRELIEPSYPTSSDLKEHKLSFVDQFLDDLYAPFLLFYQKNNADLFKTSQNLKQSLADTLTKFYPLAGKLAINPEGFSVIDCDDSGALFVEAEVDAPLRESLDDEKLVQYLPFDPFSGDERPGNETLLAVQITRFKCGGSAVGVCISHALADLASLLTFLNSWAVTNHGCEGKLGLNDPKFDLGRHLFPPLLQHDRPPREAACTEGGEGARKLKLKKFLFGKEKLIQLKQLASASKKIKDPTRVEVVTAFLWKQLMKVTYIASQSTVSETRFTFKAAHMVSLRGRISSLSDHDSLCHFGNLAVCSATDSFSTTAKEIIDDDDGIDLGELAGLVRGAIRKVDDDFLLTYTNIPFSFKEETNWQYFVSFCRSSAYEVDFGWGNPSLVGPGCTDHPDVKLLETSEGDVEAWVTMFEDEMDLLPPDLLSLQATQLFHLKSQP